MSTINSDHSLTISSALPTVGAGLSQSLAAEELPAGETSPSVSNVFAKNLAMMRTISRSARQKVDGLAAASDSLNDISQQLIKMQTLAEQAAEGNLSQDTRLTVQSEITSYAAKMDKLVLGGEKLFDSAKAADDESTFNFDFSSVKTIWETGSLDVGTPDTAKETWSRLKQMDNAALMQQDTLATASRKLITAWRAATFSYPDAEGAEFEDIDTFEQWFREVDASLRLNAVSSLTAQANVNSRNALTLFEI